MAYEADAERTTRWYQFRLRGLFMVAMFVALAGATWYQSVQIVRLTREVNRLTEGKSYASEELKFAGLASRSIVRRDAEGKASYLEAYGARVEVYQTFVLVYVLDPQSPVPKVSRVEFIPRDQLLQLSVQGPEE